MLCLILSQFGKLPLLKIAQRGEDPYPGREFVTVSLCVFFHLWIYVHFESLFWCLLLLLTRRFTGVQFVYVFINNLQRYVLVFYPSHKVFMENPNLSDVVTEMTCDCVYVSMERLLDAPEVVTLWLYLFSFITFIPVTKF